MNNKKSRVVSLMLVCTMLLTLALAGCKKKDDVKILDNLNPLGTVPISKDLVTIEFMMSQDGLVENYDTNKYTKEIERVGNVDIKFNLLSPADASTKLNLVLSSGKDLPDVINAGLTDDLVSTYGSAGMFIALNDYYENSSYYLKPQLEAYEKETGVDLLKYITMSDGNIYGLIKYNESLQNEVPKLLWINKTWLDKAGMKVPTTLDEFVSVLTYFKNNDMNGNGNKNDEIPMVDRKDGGMLEVIENAFVKTGIEQITLKDDGTLTMAYMTDGYKDFLKYANKLYNAGLLADVTFSQDNATLKTLLNGEETIVGVFADTSTSILTAGSPRRENQEYAPVFLDNPANGYSTLRYMKTMPGQAMFITSSNPYPETSFRVGDYMCSEKMTVWTRWGEEGTDWLAPSESTVAMYDFMGYDAYLEPVLQWGDKQNSHWRNTTPGFRRTNVSLGMASNDASQVSKAIALEELHNRYSDADWEGDGKLFFEKVADDRVYKLIFTASELEERAPIITTLDSYVKQMRYKFITGEESIDSGWDGYIKELKANNVDRLVEINNDAYKRMK